MAGLHSIEDLRQRSRIDEETGCWVVEGKTTRGALRVWLPHVGEVVSLATAIAYLVTGGPAPKGKVWYAACRNTSCGNPAHRKLATRSAAYKAMLPSIGQEHRARMTQARRLQSKAYSPAVKLMILSSDASERVIAEQIGVHPSMVGKIRRGEAWRDVLPAASVFAIGGGS